MTWLKVSYGSEFVSPSGSWPGNVSFKDGIDTTQNLIGITFICVCNSKIV